MPLLQTPHTLDVCCAVLRQRSDYGVRRSRTARPLGAEVGILNSERESMTNTPTRRENETFDRPFAARVDRTTPAHGLYQAPYSLSEAEFLVLKQSSPVLTAVGGTVLAFGLSSALPIFVDRLWPPATAIAAATRGQWTVAIVATALGLGFILLGFMWSRRRSKLLRQIERHFVENPSQLQYDR